MVVGLLVLYDWIADAARVHIPTAIAHGREVLALELHLGVAVERPMTDALAEHHSLWAPAALYYNFAHVVVTCAVLVSAYRMRPDVYRWLRNTLVAVNLVALAVFLTWPVAPPRLLPAGGFVDLVAASGTPGAWEASSTFSRHANEYASLPSLHVAWALWVLVTVAAITSRRDLRSLAMLHLALTSLVVLATGNHYVFDVVAGAAVLIGCRRICIPAERHAEEGAPAVLIVSASMGAGHDGVAYELQRRIREAGGRADVLDYLTVMPLGTGRLMKRIYAAQLRYAPASYEWLYDALERVRPLERCARGIAGCGRWPLLRHVRRGGYGLTVATYPLAGQALGQLRRRGRLGVPAVTFLTDLDVHTMWLHRGTDLYLSVYDGSAREAERRTGRPAVAVGPVLPPTHTAVVSGQERSEGRAWLGRRDDEPVVLLVTGSWGVGDVLPTVSAIADAGFGAPVVLCGHNERLRSEVEAHGVGTAVGWTEHVRPLLAAADAVVHNAGGLSSLEGFAAGVPVIGHACLPGHGQRNARAMRDAGVAALAVGTEDLVRLLHELVRTPAGSAMAGRARALFRIDPTPSLLARAGQLPSRRLTRSRLAMAATTLAVVPLVALAAGLGVSEASERYGFGLARPTSGQPPGIYVAALLDPAEISDSSIAALLQREKVSAVVPASVARSRPEMLARLGAAGVSILAEEPRSARHHQSARAADESVKEIGTVTGQSRTPLVLLSRPSPLMLIVFSRSHVRLGLPDSVLRPGDSPQLFDREQVVVDLTGADREASLATLQSLQQQAALEGLLIRPWGSLWRLR